MKIGSARTAKQKMLSGLLVFALLIAVSLALGFYGYYTERASRTPTNTTPTTSPTTTPTTTPTPTITPTTTPTTTPTPTNTTIETPYEPE